MWTNEQEKKVENAIARMFIDSKIRDFRLVVKRSDNAPDTMAIIDIKIRYEDMQDRYELFQMSEDVLQNIFSKNGVDRPRTISITTSVFKAEVHIDTFVHFYEN